MNRDAARRRQERYTDPRSDYALAIYSSLGWGPKQIGALFLAYANWCGAVGYRSLESVAREQIGKLRVPPTKDRVYFIQPGKRQLVKIGVAHRPKDRLKELQTGSPDAIRVIGELPGGMPVERALHRCLGWYRERGEWFRMSAPIFKILELAKLPPSAWEGEVGVTP